VFLSLGFLGLAGCERNPTQRLIGSKAPDFTVKDSERTVNLRDFRGKLVVLNFWATYCAPCVEEMPSLVRLQSQMGSNVTILGVSSDPDEGQYRRFLETYHINFLTVRDPRTQASALYGTTGLPETFIIDRSGVVRRKLVGPADWSSPEMIDYLNKL
jgi:cytochrome c biogenesis protein CcmG, thiol:disulfide interchange protein DsbE